MMVNGRDDDGGDGDVHCDDGDDGDGDGRTDGRMCGWRVDGWMARWIDGWTGDQWMMMIDDAVMANE